MQQFTSLDWIVLASALIIMLAILIFVPRLLVMRAMKQVIKNMRNLNATSPKNAKTAEQIGIRGYSLWDRMFKMRDYKPQAFYLLIEMKIIVDTGTGKYYLSEDRLAQSKFRNI